MPYVTCPTCGERGKIPSNLIGARIKCRKCGLSFQVSPPAPAKAVIYCSYVGYPAGCVARAGVVLRPRPVARAAVRGTTATRGNLNGGVNRVGVRR